MIVKIRRINSSNIYLKDEENKLGKRTFRYVIEICSLLKILLRNFVWYTSCQTRIRRSSAKHGNFALLLDAINHFVRWVVMGRLMIEGKLNKKKTLFPAAVLICTVHYPWPYPKIEAINVNIDEMAEKKACIVVGNEISRGKSQDKFPAMLFFQGCCVQITRLWERNM